MCSIFRRRFNSISVYVCVTVQLNSFILVSVFYVKILWITRYINNTISSWAIGVSIFLIDFRYYNCNADFSCFFNKGKKERKRIKYLLKKLSNSIRNYLLFVKITICKKYTPFVAKITSLAIISCTYANENQFHVCNNSHALVSE